MKKSLLVLLVLSIFGGSSFAQRDLGVRPTDSGGPLMPEQAAYDVQNYDISVRLDIPNKSIDGIVTVKARIVKPLSKFVLDLDYPFAVSSVSMKSGKGMADLKFERKEGRIWIDLPSLQTVGKVVDVRVVYSGKPKVAPRPPWVGGFMWEKTPAGAPWIATAVQNDGADLWWPVKDHPSDKAATSDLHFTVPNGLVAASNGRLVSTVPNSDGTTTFNWHVSQPISNYCIALNVAPYKLIEDKVKSITGEMMPISFYVLSEHAEKAPQLIEQLKKYVAFFEEYLGPYSFRADKIGIVETPHLGMEHQSITAYGNNFKFDADGFDWLLFHEFGHEWWANLVTAPDWNDFWIHEGFQSYMDTFFLEKMKGKQAYFEGMKKRRQSIRNVKPVAPREPQTTTQIYMLPPDYIRSDGDIYGKGALILHTLRFYVGDDAFFRSIRRLAYPTPAMEKVSNGRQNHFSTTDDFLSIAERESGKRLGWFFEQYLRQPALPKLIVEEGKGSITLHWEAIPGIVFPMPIEIKIGDKVARYDIKGRTTIQIPNGVKYEIDPNGWVLKAK